MSHPCSYCGVRTDVACRHRAASPMPKAAKHFNDGYEVDKRDGRIGIQFWASAMSRGVKPETIMEALKAAL